MRNPREIFIILRRVMDSNHRLWICNPLPCRSVNSPFVILIGLEPITYTLEECCSIQLSYRDILALYLIVYYMTISIRSEHSINIIYGNSPMRIRDHCTAIGGVVCLRNGVVVCDWGNG